MNMIRSNAPKPSAPAGKGRIQILDILRGIAVFGILAINIGNLGLPWQANDNPNLYSNGTGFEHWTQFFTYLIFEGKMRGLFSLLFGASMVLLITGLEKRMSGMATTAFYIRRMIWLIGFGLIHGYLLLYPGDILFTYALAGFFLLPFRKVKPKVLFQLATVILLAITAGFYLEAVSMEEDEAAYLEALEKERSGLALTADELEDKTDWEEELAEINPTKAVLNKTVETYRDGSYFDILSIEAEDTFGAQTRKLLELGFWDSLMMMLIGIALMKMGFLQYRFKNSTYWKVLMVAFPIWIIADSMIINMQINHYSKLVEIEYTDSLYQLGRVAGTIGQLCIIMLIAKLPILTWVGNAIAQVGRMALTNYILQTVACIWVFYGFGLGLFGELLRIELYYVVFAVWTFQLVFSAVWMHYFRFGPLEWVWRSLCYWKAQPLLRKKAVEPIPLLAPTEQAMPEPAAAK